MNVLFVPCLGLDPTLIERLAKSVDFPVQHKVALNNGPAGALDGFANAHRDWDVRESPVGNMGVAASWNWCAKTFSQEKAWLFMNEDAWFLPGQLEKMCNCADATPHTTVIHGNESNAYYCFVWTAAGRQLVGTFDENLWPAYYEDCDYRVRMRKLGFLPTYAMPTEPPIPHGKPITGGMNYGAMINGCGLFNRAYWFRKWGGFDFENTNRTNPYADHRVPLNEWVYYPENRARMQPIWDTFMSLPNPSIYG